MINDKWQKNRIIIRYASFELHNNYFIWELFVTQTIRKEKKNRRTEQKNIHECKCGIDSYHCSVWIWTFMYQAISQPYQLWTFFFRFFLSISLFCLNSNEAKWKTLNGVTDVPFQLNYITILCVCVALKVQWKTNFFYSRAP